MSTMALPVPASMAEPKKSRRWRTPLPRFGKTSIDRASFFMLRLYRANLEVRLRCIDEDSLQTECQRQIYAAATEMMKAPAENTPLDLDLEWDEIYKTERYIALLLGDGRLRHEIGARLQELADDGVLEADRLRREYEALIRVGDTQPPADDGVLRAFLLRILELQHWCAKKKYLARPIRKEATKILLIFVLSAFFMVVAPYIYLVLDFDPSKDGDLEKIGKSWSLFALYTTLVSGLLGAYFSRLVTLHRQWSTMNLDEVFLHREVLYTMLRAGVGMCGALIVYFFLQAGLISGGLFPDFDKLAIRFVRIPEATSNMAAVHMVLAIPSPDLALLTIWSFLAGFSEMLVPSILANTERQLSSATAVKA